MNFRHPTTTPTTGRNWLWLPALAVILATGIGGLGYDQPLFLFLNGELLRWLPDRFWEIATIGGNTISAVLALGALLLLPYPQRFSAALALALPLSLTIQSAKWLIDRLRPLKVFEEEAVYLIGEPLYFRSLPSGHTSTVFFAFTVVALTFGRGYRTPCLALAAIGGVARVAVGAHFPVDILLGAAIGWSFAHAMIPLSQTAWFNHARTHGVMAGFLVFAAIMALMGNIPYTVSGYQWIQTVLAGVALSVVAIFFIRGFIKRR